MGSTAQTLLKFLPGAMETAGGAATGNPALATMGASQLAGAGASMLPGAPSATQQPQQGLGSMGNLLGQVGAPALGTMGSIMANRTAGVPPAPTPMAQPQRAAQPLTPSAPAGPAQTSSPLSSLAAYAQFLKGMG